MAEPTPGQRTEARAFAQSFTEWVEKESGIDFWSECNGEDELEERLTKEIAILIAERDAARQAHERLRQAVVSDYVTFDRDASALICCLCNALIRESVDRSNANHAPDCPLTPLEEPK